MSSHWLDVNNKVVVDGIRSALPGEVRPGETAVIDVITKIPKDPGNYFLKLSPVQEGCAWFYLADSTGLPSIQIGVE